MSVVLLGEQTPTFPEDFQRQLQAFDKDLLITWHRPLDCPDWPRRRRGMWKIEMCFEHHGGLNRFGYPDHSYLCRRTYVLMCQDDDGTPIPLGEWVFTKLREMRANSESYGGQTKRGLTNFIATSNRLDQELEAKRQADSADMIRYNQKDKRVQLNRLYSLIERHDMRPNK